MEVDDERQVVGGVAGQPRVGDPGVADLDGPRTNALSSEATGQYAGNERNRDRGAVTCWKPCRANGPRASVLRQSLKSPTIRVGRCADSRNSG